MKLPGIKNLHAIGNNQFCCQTSKGIAVFTEKKVLIEYPIVSRNFELLGLTKNEQIVIHVDDVIKSIDKR